MTHIAIECYESRYRAFFADEGSDQWDPGERLLEAGRLPGTAAEGIAYLTEAYGRWRGAIAGLTDEALLRPLGPKGATFADDPMVELVLHINREAIHHRAEICLLRDLSSPRCPWMTRSANRSPRSAARRVCGCHLPFPDFP